jgi:EAL domain-containing protein (putative c-di-GMP-specific phosphodiesterase class I)
LTGQADFLGIPRHANVPGKGSGASKAISITLNLNQLALYYQPKVDTRTGEVRSAGARIRWLHPTRGVVSPAISSRWLKSAN